MLQSSHTLFRRTLLMGCALVWGIAGIQASVLTDFLAALEQQTLQSDFTITVSEEVSQPMNYPGSITMQGNRFRLAMFDTEAAYDGNTLYIYSAFTDELTLSKPTESELLEANPFLYAKALVEVCTISERPAKDPAQTIITLTPKDQSVGIQRFTLRHTCLCRSRSKRVSNSPHSPSKIPNTSLLHPPFGWTTPMLTSTT